MYLAVALLGCIDIATAAEAQNNAPANTATPTASAPLVSLSAPLPDDTGGISGSVYVAMDSWIYPAFARLQALGYADTAFEGLRPWTRKSCLHILQETEGKNRSRA